MQEKPSEKRELTSGENVKLMVDTFYAKVNEDEMLAPVFNDVAKVNWETHLPRMYTFWESVLFGTAIFNGQPFAKHVPLPIDGQHFERWIHLFCTNIDEHFSGAVAEDAKGRARSIGAMFQSKLNFFRGKRSL